MLEAPPVVLLAFLLAVGISPGSSAHIESISANVDRKVRHETFVPLVAFDCGYRNKYLNESGQWQSDPSGVATCLEGKLDILKYCKRVYPNRKITNIVEYSHISQISNWCKEDGRNCRHSFYIRPYRCIEGDFIADSLQVPSKCRFGHVSGRDSCEDFKQWSKKAEFQCSLSNDGDVKKPMKLHSFAMLEPCGLSLFRGVEYVCCPKLIEEKYADAKLNEFLDDTETPNEDIEDDEEEDDEESLESDIEKSKKEEDRDPYFDEEPNVNEHERFKDAQERLEKRHRSKVTEVIMEWSELFERYNKMKEKDPAGADAYKEEMTSRFRKTVAALEEENREQRRQLDDLHDERVQAALNEKKRKATHDYRMALALQVGSLNKKNVLKTLKEYIAAEEKDRTHMLNRYRHLLRSNQDAAVAFEPMLLHRLRYIDLRINGTLAMLRDFPKLEKQIRPIAEEFWQEYRRENTPEIDHQILDEKTSNDSNEKLVQFYKKAYDHSPHPTSSVDLIHQSIKTARFKTKKVSLEDILSEKNDEDSDEDQFEEDDEEEDEIEEVTKIKTSMIVPNKTAEQQKKKKKQDYLEKRRPIKITNEFVDEEMKPRDLDTDDDNDEDEETEEKEQKITIADGLIVRKEIGPSFSRHDKVMFDQVAPHEQFSSEWGSPTSVVVCLTVILCLAGVVGVILRSRPSRKGFIEVNVTNPDDQDIAKMQVNGYENPTYTYFDSKT